MLFTQLKFIFVFLPITLIGYFLVARFTRYTILPILWLAGASLVFYAQWNVGFLRVIIWSIIVNYAFGFVIAAQPAGMRRKVALGVAVAANLAALGYYKYSNFGIGLLNHVTHGHLGYLNLTLPLGISFFTFTQIAYLADVYGGYAKERNLGKYALFVTYFPHLIAGPILHHSEMMPQFGAPESRRFSTERLAVGISIFAVGLVKKAVIADGFALIANPVFTAAGKGLIAAVDAWGGALAYALQIYFDFSGYCDMAIGLSFLFGIVLPFNFDSPYKSLSIVEFWRRWHITLSRFLRDYLYIALGGNRHGRLRRYANLGATMLLGGLWHGAGVTFIVWGGLHGLYLIINHLWSEWSKSRPAVQASKGTLPYAVLALLVTQFAVIIAWVFFRAENMAMARHMLHSMFRIGKAASLPQTASIVDGTLLFAVLVGYLICLLAPNVNWMFERWHVGLKTYNNTRPWSLADVEWRLRPVWAIGTAVALVVGIAVSAVVGEASPFLYFQF